VKQKKILLLVIVIAVTIVLLSGCTSSTGDQSSGASTADEQQAVDQDADPLSQLLGSRSQGMQIVGLLTILSLAPSILIMVTGFTRIIIVLSLTRNAMGIQQTPPNQVIVALALFLTFFVMMPVIDQIKTDALEPYAEHEITAQEAVEAAEVPLREFMLKQTYKSDLNLFMDVSDQQSVQSLDDVPMSTIIPAYMTSEIKRGFQIGFFIYIPFIVIDMVVASTLMAMGMMMLPPTVISLPFKVLLFILVDGWGLMIQSLISSFS
jgi:flagellar biosynthetic protein FliP